jgi:peptidoglycan/LPS O-acetylase OafA/YrhL
MNELSLRNTTLKYRPDIDGLRCVAVLSVLAFHLSPNRMPGGFVGVDVFFVISGYLISAIVFSEINESRFSIVGFYERRVRRIFPALFAMLIVVSAVLSFLLLPSEFTQYAKSVIAATTSSSNFYFWQHSGYFDSPTSFPLLHTWSLAVEEQFYLLFPIFLVITRHFFPKHLKLAVVILFFASLIASEATLHYSATTAFYMPYTRAWELLLGTTISLGFFPRLSAASLRNCATILGITMIGYSIFRFNAQTPFPGIHALIPCLGSALIIGAGESGSSFVSNGLSWKPVVFIGLISYSLYLWHWPIIVLNDLGFSPDFTALVPHRWAIFLASQTARKSMQIVLSLTLATLSWRFVERPFRSHARRIQRRPLFALSGAVIVMLILASEVVIYANGFESRFPTRAVQVASFLSSSDIPASVAGGTAGPDADDSAKGVTAAPVAPAVSLGQLGHCSITAANRETVFGDNSCLEAIPGKKTYLLLGDSTAGALYGGLTTLPGADVLLAAVWGCKPSLQSDGTPLCKQMLNFIFQKYLAGHPVDGLLVEARWYRQNLSALGDIVAWGKENGVKVTVIGPVVEYDAPLPRLLAYSIAWNKPDLPEQHRSTYSAVLDDEMRNLAKDWHVCYVSIYQATCEGDHCVEYADEKKSIPLLSDEVHLSVSGSKFMAHRLSGLGELECIGEPRPSKSDISLDLR